MICSVRNCKDERGYGDSYFCNKHRLGWRNNCQVIEINEKIICDETSKEYLKEFMNNE